MFTATTVADPISLTQPISRKAEPDRRLGSQAWLSVAVGKSCHMSCYCDILMLQAEHCFVAYDCSSGCLKLISLCVCQSATPPWAILVLHPQMAPGSGSASNHKPTCKLAYVSNESLACLQDLRQASLSPPPPPLPPSPLAPSPSPTSPAATGDTFILVVLGRAYGIPTWISS